MNTPADLLFSEDHEWVRLEGTIATIGITDFAQDALGDVVFVELPEVGATATAGETISEVESTKSVSDIIAPVSGTVTEANTSLDDNPAVLNSDPYGEGWIFKVERPDDSAPVGLMDAEAYTAFTADS